jgi:UDP-glucose 4-epimerase
MFYFYLFIGPFDYIYHIAAYAAEGLSHFIRHYNYENNLIGGINLINEAVKQKPIVKAFVFTSSIAAFGTSDGKPPFTELSPKRPEDPYGIAKMAFEQDLQAAYHMFGLHYIIFRPHNVYGPRQNIADKFRNAIGIFMNQILRNENITIFGDGEQKRAFSYISDVSTIIGSSVLFYPAAYNNDFFVGSDTEYSVNSLAVEVIKAMNRTASITHLDSRKEVVDAFPVHNKLRCIFNPPTPVTLEEGLQITAKYVVKHGPFEPSGYTNIEVTDHLPPSWSQCLMKKTGDQTNNKRRIN